MTDGFDCQKKMTYDLIFCDYTGVPVRAINRPGSQLLGANGRDDGPIVSFLCTSNMFLSSLCIYELCACTFAFLCKCVHVHKHAFDCYSN